MECGFQQVSKEGALVTVIYHWAKAPRKLLLPIL